MIVVALSAVIVPLILLVILNVPATKGMTLSAIIVSLLALFFWKMSGFVILSSMLQAVHKTATILWILFGALVLLNTLRRTGAINRINQGFKYISGDMRVQAVMVAFLFGSLIEGAAGFGTPAMVTAPLLIAIGFSPMAAITLSLIADSTSVSFGAVGTPISVGLSNLEVVNPAFLWELGETITFIDLFVGSFIPIILIVMLTRFFNKNFRMKDIISMLPWSLLIGFTYTTSALLFSYWFGYEFVSILAPLIGLAVAAVTAHKKWLLPKEEWQGAMIEGVQEVSLKPSMNLFSAWAPYIVVVVLLLATRIFPWLHHLTTTAFDLSWYHILGIQEIHSDWKLLNSPGTILVIAALFASFFQRKSSKDFIKAARSSVLLMRSTAVALISTLAMVQVFSNSGLNIADLHSMPEYIAHTFSGSMGKAWIFVAPFIGELGSFITGSATVSNLTFSPIQYNVAAEVGLDAHVILALQVIGGSAGSMICVHNVVAASAVVGLIGKEGEIIRKTIVPALLYGLLTAIVGFILLA